jgi:hypothetical protein
MGSEDTMARSNLSRDTARALVPVLVPLVTKVALPLAIDSLRRRGRFDTDAFIEGAKESLGKGLKESGGELKDLGEKYADRGEELYSDLRKHGADLLEALTERGGEWLETVRPRRRRRSKLLWVLGAVAVVGVGLALLSRE